MRFASIFYRHTRENRLFADGAGENNGSFFLPFSLLRKHFAANDVELNTPDVNRGREVLFELHINAQRRRPIRPGYVYLYENSLIRPRNEDRKALEGYRQIFTWNPVLAQAINFTLSPSLPRAAILAYPNRITVVPSPAFEGRPHGCVLVAANKSLPRHDVRDLYPRRQQLVRAFDRIAPAGFFGLYGQGWEYPAARPGRLGKLMSSLRKRLSLQAKPIFCCWRGPIQDKDALLRQSRFAICYENGADLPGYISEKIFDCFRNGCVPIYWGPADIALHIPKECFIDARAFVNEEALVAHVLSIDGQGHAEYQAAIKKFLLSEAANRFSEEYFAEYLVNSVMADEDYFSG